MKYLVLFLSLFLSVNFIHAQEFCMASPIGFGGNAKGGTGGTVVTVDNYNDLKTQLTKDASTKLIVVITKDITFGEGKMIRVKGGKTILGMPGVRLISTSQTASGGIFQLNENDIIIRNLVFEGPGAYDVDGQDLLQNTACDSLWVDHCEFYDGVDGNFDNTKKADNVTISWCKFGYNKPPKEGGKETDDHRFTNLVGGSKSDAPADKHYSITFQYCFWSEGCRERMPRARNAELHILNCYYDTKGTGDKALGLGGGANSTTCYVEGCDFKSINKVYTAYPKDGGDIAVNYVDCINTDKTAVNIGTVAKPAYTYSAIAASAVEEAVLSTYGSGATLLVNEQGKVWIPGEGSGLNNPTEAPEWSIKQINNTVEVSGVEAKDLAVYSLSGNLLSYSDSQAVSVAHLNKGFYVLTVTKKNGEKLSKKFIKQ